MFNDGLVTLSEDPQNQALRQVKQRFKKIAENPKDENNAREINRIFDKKLNEWLQELIAIIALI
ncbi:hypothetical protein CBS470a_013563 [Colletotrichum nupharicola]|nr:hypothetical protein CBS470a_013563 [Colletotrichum nupharicola]